MGKEKKQNVNKENQNRKDMGIGLERKLDCVYNKIYALHGFEFMLLGPKHQTCPIK